MSSALQLISGARKLLPNIIILLVGGNQAIPYSIGSETKKKLHNRGARVFVVAIGDGTSINELRLITQRKDVFQLSSFEDLRPNIPRIAHELGKQPGLYAKYYLVFFMPADQLQRWKVLNN